MATRNLIAFLAILPLSACASLPRPAAIPEGIWQGLNAVDFSQTVMIARQPHVYAEGDRLTSAIIGSHPSESAVEGYWLGYSLLHYVITSWLARMADVTGKREWTWALYGWEAISIGSSAYEVAHNARIGLKPFGPHEATGDGYFPYCDSVAAKTPCVSRY